MDVRRGLPKQCDCLATNLTLAADCRHELLLQCRLPECVAFHALLPPRRNRVGLPVLLGIAHMQLLPPSPPPLSNQVQTLIDGYAQQTPCTLSWSKPEALQAGIAND